MKKLFTILAMAILLVACGGNNSKKDAKEQTVEVKEQTVEEKAVAYFSGLLDAYKAGDLDACLELAEEMEEWGSNLNEEDGAKAQNAMLEWAQELSEEDFMAFDALMSEME